MSDGNGNGARQEGTARLVLVFHPATFALQVDFAGPNLDCAISMLQQAQREFEGQLRAAKALQLQQQMREQAENAQIARNLRGKG